MRRQVVRSRLWLTRLSLAALVLSGCERLADDARKDRGLVKILHDGEYRLVEAEF